MTVARRSQGQSLSSAPDSLPHDSDAEAGALGCMMAGNPAVVDEGTRLLCQDDFYEDKHRAIFHAACQLQQAGKDVNIVSVTHAISDAGKIQDVGGPAYIASLPNLIPLPSVLPDYIARLVKKKLERRAVQVSEILTHDIRCGGGVSSEARAEMRQLLEALDTPQGQDVPGPQIKRIGAGNDWIATWDQFKVGISIEQLRDEHGDLRGRIRITSLRSPRTVIDHVSLDSSRSRAGVFKIANERFPGLPWDRIIEDTCLGIAEAQRAGESVAVLQPAPTRKRSFLIDKFLEEGQPQILYGDGKCGKSVLALACAVSIGVMLPLPNGLRPTRQATTLYLDYEADKDVHGERLGALLRGMKVEYDPKCIFYRKMTRTLGDDISYIRSEVDRLSADLVIVDSCGPATLGGERDWNDAAVHLMNSIRSLRPGVTSLLLAHLSHRDARATSGSGRPFGGVYLQNLSRSSWEMRKSDDMAEGALCCGLYHRTANNGHLLLPMAFRFEFTDDQILVKSGNVAEFPDLMARTSIQAQVLQALTKGRKPTAKVADELGIKPDVARTTLNRLKGTGKVIPFPTGTGKETEWGLPAPQGEPVT